MYRPLAGVKVLDIGKLLPPAETTLLLASLGADVVKIELPEVGDSIRDIGVQGDSPYHHSMNVGKRSVALDLRLDADREVFFELAAVADVIVENALAGRWAAIGIDFEELRRQRPELIVCSITGFGQTGPWSTLASHGMNMDALAGVLPIDWDGDQPHMGPTFCSWANELGSTSAAFAIAAALVEVRSSGEGAWIDISCWDAAVTVHRATLTGQARRGDVSAERLPAQPREVTGDRGALYDTYRCADGRLFLMASLEAKFWVNFCRGVGREDLVDQWAGSGQLGFGGVDNQSLRSELEEVFLTAPADEWQRRFVEWDVAGGEIVGVHELMSTDHFVARGIREDADGDSPYLATAVRWHHTGERAGQGLSVAPALGEHREEVLGEWLGH